MALAVGIPTLAKSARVGHPPNLCFLHPQLPEQERINIRELLNLLRHRLPRAVPRLGLNPQQDWGAGPPLRHHGRGCPTRRGFCSVS